MASGMDQVAAIEREALEHLELATDEAGLESWFRAYLGRRDGKLSGLLRQMGQLDAAERPRFGAAVNEAKVCSPRSNAAQAPSWPFAAMSRLMPPSTSPWSRS